MTNRDHSPSISRNDGGDAKLRTEGSARLIHFSDKPLVRVRSVRQERHVPGEYRSHHDKPNGLWLSVEGPDDWAAWCEAENFRDTRQQYAAEVLLSDRARLLRLCCAEDIDVFTEDYGFDYQGAGFVNRVIDWRKVAEEWHGIVIAPYVWERRLTRLTGWYYGWDCASGVIWNARAVADIRPIATPPPPSAEPGEGGSGQTLEAGQSLQSGDA